MHPLHNNVLPSHKLMPSPINSLPCYLVPSSRGRLLVISMTISLQASRSLVSPHSSLSVQFVMALMSSSHRARGLPLFLAPPPIPNIIDFSKLFSLRMMCPKYDSCCFFISASSGLVVLISSITDLLVLLAVHGILSSLLQHHNSKLSIINSIGIITGHVYIYCRIIMLYF